MKPLTKSAFTKFCASKPEAEAYNFYAKDCAWGQFLSASGRAITCVGFSTWTDAEGDRHDFPADVAGPVETLPHTFGALAARLRRSAS